MLDIILIILATFVTLVCCALMFAIIGVYLYCLYLLFKVICQIVLDLCKSLDTSSYEDNSESNINKNTDDNNKTKD